MVFDPAQYDSQQSQIVSVTLQSDGDTITVVSTAYDPDTGAQLDNISANFSLSVINQQISTYSSVLQNWQDFVNVIQPSIQTAQSSGQPQSIAISTQATGPKPV